MKKVLSFQSVARQLSRRTPQCFNNNNKVLKQTFVTHSSMSSAQFIGQSSPGHNWFLEEPYTMSIIGAPINTGQPKTGVEKGPSSIREIGLIEKVREVGWRVIDEGDIDIPQIDESADPTTEYGLKRSRATAAANKSLHERVYMAAKQGNFVTTIGGDHSLGVGSVSGILRARPKTRVIWVDAHADINTDTTSPSGNIHGMSVALLMQLHNLDHFPGWEWMRDLDPLPESNIVYIGLRDIDPGEKTILWKLGIRSFSMYEVDRYGIGPVIDMAIKSVDPKGKHPLHVSFDIDSLDPTVAPSTGTPVVGGLTFREGAFLLESLASTNRLCSMDLVEVNPDAGETEKEQTQTVEMGRRMISCASGELLLWGDQPHYRQ